MPFALNTKLLHAIACKHKTITAAIAVALAGLVLFARRPDALINPQLFAEDGLVFFLGAYESGLSAIMQPYGGYYHLVPRLIALVALKFDPSWVPFIYNFAALTIVCLINVAVFSKRISLPAKPLIVLSLALVPHTGEVFLNLTNIQWWLAVALILVLLSEDASKTIHYFCDITAVVLCGLSGPFLVFVFPIFIVRACMRRSSSCIATAIMAGIVCSIQIFCLYNHRSEFERSGLINFSWLGSVMTGRVFGTFAAGYKIDNLSSSPLWLIFGALATAAFLRFAFCKGNYRSERAIIGSAWICYVVPVGLKFLRETGAIAPPLNGDRYFFLPHILLAWMLVVYCASPSKWAKNIAAVILGLSWILNSPSFQTPPLKDYAWTAHVQPIREGKDFQIPINPPGWIMSSSGKNTKR